MAISMHDKNRKYLKKDDIIKYDHDYYWLDYNKEKQHWVLIGLSTERIITPPGLVALLAKSERIGTINNEQQKQTESQNVKPIRKTKTYQF